MSGTLRPPQSSHISYRRDRDPTLPLSWGTRTIPFSHELEWGQKVGLAGC